MKYDVDQIITIAAMLAAADRRNIILSDRYLGSHLAIVSAVNKMLSGEEDSSRADDLSQDYAHAAINIIESCHEELEMYLEEQAHRKEEADE